MENCIFCKIAKGEIPSYKVYEDEDTLAFLDIKPLNKGHTLVIPKKHYRWVWDIKEICNFYEDVGKVANAIRKAMKTDFLVSLVLGQEIQHAHVWLVPRYENDGHGSAIDINLKKQFTDKEMKETAEKIRKAL